MHAQVGQNAAMHPVLAIDVGGTKYAAGLVAPDGTVVSSRRVPTPQGADAETLWLALESLIDAVVDDAGGSTVDGVGVGASGPMEWPAGLLSPLNIPGWRAFPLLARIAAKLPGVPVRIHNDAICLALAEHWRGAGRGHDNMIGMVVSTGVGGGLILGGRAVDGATGNAGHIGHIVVVPDGQACGCGGRGCLEAETRGPRVTAWAVREGWQPPADTEANPSARDLAHSARAGDPIAIGAYERAGSLLGLGIASAVALTDVDLVVIGGGLSQAGPLLFGPLRASYRRHARIDFARSVSVVPAELNQDAGLVGAAALVARADRYWSRA